MLITSENPSGTGNDYLNQFNGKDNMNMCGLLTNTLCMGKRVIETYPCVVQYPSGYIGDYINVHMSTCSRGDYVEDDKCAYLTGWWGKYPYPYAATTCTSNASVFVAISNQQVIQNAKKGVLIGSLTGD